MCDGAQMFPKNCFNKIKITIASLHYMSLININERNIQLLFFPVILKVFQFLNILNMFRRSLETNTFTLDA